MFHQEEPLVIYHPYEGRGTGRALIKTRGKSLKVKPASKNNHCLTYLFTEPLQYDASQCLLKLLKGLEWDLCFRLRPSP